MSRWLDRNPKCLLVLLLVGLAGICAVSVALILAAARYAQQGQPQVVTCTPSIAHEDALEDSFRPMLLSLEWWSDVLASGAPELAADDTSTLPGVSSSRKKPVDEDRRCAAVIQLAIIAHPGGKPSTVHSSSSSQNSVGLSTISELFGMIPSVSADIFAEPASAAKPVMTWLWVDTSVSERAIQTREDAEVPWFPATVYAGRFQWASRVFALQEATFRCNGVRVEQAMSAWDIITGPQWSFVQFRFATCFVYGVDDIDAEAIMRRAATAVSLTTERLTFWSGLFGWARQETPRSEDFARAWVSVAGAMEDATATPEAFVRDAWLVAADRQDDLIADCTAGPHLGDLSVLPLSVARYPAKKLRVVCHHAQATTLDLSEESTAETARAHLRPIGFFALAVYTHQLLHIQLPSSVTLLAILMVADAPLWISLRLLLALICPSETDMGSSSSLPAPPPPTMLLVATSALHLAPTTISAIAIVLCVLLDAFRAEQGRRCWVSRTFYEGGARNPLYTLIDAYDVAVLPLLMISWAGVPALFTLTDESPYASTIGFAAYLVAIPAYAAFSRTLGQNV